MTAAVAPSSHTLYGGSEPDPIDEELDWLIEKDEQERGKLISKEAENDERYSSDDDDSLRDRSPSPVTPSSAMQSSPRYSPSDMHSSPIYSPSPRGSPRGSPNRSPRGFPNNSQDYSPRSDSPEFSPRRDSPEVSPRRDSPEVSPRRDSPDTSPRRDSPETSPRKDSSRADSPGASSGPDDDETFQYTQDQKQAMTELNNMKLDLGMEEDPPEYDVRDRVRQLNEELANEPSPDDDKERSIKFKENPVSLVVPPPSDTEEDSDNKDSETQDKNDDKDSDKDSDRDTENTQEQDSDGDSTARSRDSHQWNDDESHDDDDDDKHSNYDKDDDEKTKNIDNKILVERNGKFEFLDVSELTAEEREMYNVPESSSEESVEHQPKPPRAARPKTAGSESQANRQNTRRVQSAKPHSQGGSGDPEWNEDFAYTSPYAMTSEQKQEMAKTQRDDDKKKKNDNKEKDKKEKERIHENNDAFNAWLRKKRESSKRNKSQDRESKHSNKSESDSEENKRDPNGAYKDWVKTKKSQSKDDKKDQKKQKQEVDEGWYIRPRSECDKAFKDWLKKKNGDIKRQQDEDKQRARIHKLWLRRSRKSQQLAKAIRQAQSFRYVDYYGYRDASSDFPTCTSSNSNQPQSCTSG